jgi:hypothetical protein
MKGSPNKMSLTPKTPLSVRPFEVQSKLREQEEKPAETPQDKAAEAPPKSENGEESTQPETLAQSEAPS